MNQVKKIDAATLSEMNAEQAKMQTAFALVSPDTQGRNWKDKIDCYVSGKSLADAGVSINDVLASVLYMTGTSAKLTPVHDRSWRVTAPGYWAGPCN